MTGREEREAEIGGGALPPKVRSPQVLPGLAAVSLYMLVLAGVNILGVAGRQVGPLYLVFSAVFIAAALGLLMLFRWAWALTLGAVALLMSMFFWKAAAQQEFAFAVQGLLNLVFFFYLVRTEVRGRLR